MKKTKNVTEAEMAHFLSKGFQFDDWDVNQRFIKNIFSSRNSVLCSNDALIDFKR